MMDRLEKLYDKPWFDKAFSVTVIVKGFDGLVELVAGIALIISPGLVHWFLGGLGEWFGHRHMHVLQLFGESIARIDGEFSHTGLLFLIFFLVSHGVVKLALVYCLLKKILRAYPYAIAVLVLFMVYQVYVMIIHPSWAMAFFVFLDIAIIVLAYGEYRKLLREQAEAIPR